MDGEGVHDDGDHFLVEVEVAPVLHLLIREVNHLGQQELAGAVP